MLCVLYKENNMAFSHCKETNKKYNDYVSGVFLLPSSGQQLKKYNFDQ